MVVYMNRGLLTGSLTLILAAFAGAMAAKLFVLAVARRVQKMSILVICGVMIGYICSAVTDIVVAFAQDSNIVNLHNWSQGSFSGMTWGNVQAAALVGGCETARDAVYAEGGSGVCPIHPALCTWPQAAARSEEDLRFTVGNLLRFMAALRR